ncbi:MAG: hypothetical protein IJV35_00780 [Neisseriaceae bacterium]|nr:hypothetical protein [Neisseriaceae bacterium]
MPTGKTNADRRFNGVALSLSGYLKQKLVSLRADRQLLMALPFTTVSPRAVRRGGLVGKIVAI